MENIETSGSALATGGIAARFISQNALDEANAVREKEWKDAYERIGQEPPPKMPDQPHDGRTLYERLKEQEELKQEEWDNKMKLSNQYRGLDSDEMAFLADKIKQQQETERRVADEDNREVQEYREALAKKHAKASAASESQPSTSKAEIVAPKRIPVKPKKDIKSLMKGVVVKRKPKASPSPASSSQPLATKPQLKRPIEDEPLIDKKRKV